MGGVKMTDRDYMLLAVELGQKGRGHTRPNPPVGAVLVKNGRIIGRGWHRRAGGDHAEVAALKDARRRHHSPKGATIYVTLEPCSKPGRVGACTDALIAAGIARVVYGVNDPNPVNRGKAKRILARAGIACDRVSDLDARLLVLPFAKRVMTGLPFVTVKIAMTLDGRIADDAGRSRWISSAKARRLTGRLRNEVDAIMVGAETVRKDDPLLLPHEGANADLIRVVVSRSGRLPKKARVFTEGPNRTLVFGDAVKALRELGRMGCMHVLCEGGLKLATSLAEAGLVDCWVTVLVPKVIGRRRVDKAVELPLACCIKDRKGAL